MPLGQGIMCVGRITIHRTNTFLVSVSPIPANCGDMTFFHIQVQNVDGGVSPTGTVSVIDLNTNIIIASGSLNSDGVVVLTAILSNYTNKFIVSYSGVLNRFAPSVSNVTEYNVDIINTTTTINAIPRIYVCRTQSVIVSAHVVSNIEDIVPIGNVQFKLYTDNDNYLILPDGTLDGYGDAYSAIPSFTTVPGNDYWLQAAYDGYNCLNTSESLGGTLGTIFHSTEHDTTTTSIFTLGLTHFNTNYSPTFFGSTNGNIFSPPSIGLVTFYAAQRSNILNLGVSSVIDGNSSINVPSNTFTDGYWDITANYITDGYCYNSSTSSPLTVLVTLP